MSRPLDYDMLAADYATHRRVHPGVLRQLIEGGALGAGSRALEVGCGSGNYLVAITGATGATVEGIDPSAEMLGQLAAQAPAAHAVQGRAEALPWPDATFDLVYSVDVIHHVGDRTVAAREALRVLKPGGRICIVTDSEEDLARRVPLTAFFPETLEKEQQRYPTIGTIQGELAAAGLTLEALGHAEVAYPLTDISAFRAKAYSSLHLISEEAHAAGIARLEAALAQGPIAALSLYTLVWACRG